MTLAPPRPAPPASRTVTLRSPDRSNRAVMNRRAWWLAALAIALQGSAQLLAGSRRLGRFAIGLWLAFWAVAIIAGIGMLLVPQIVLGVALTTIGLTVLQIGLIAWLVLWGLLIADTFRLAQVPRARTSARVGVPILLVVALVAGVGAGGWSANLLGVARGALGTVFASNRILMPADGRYNILLLGGDAGAGRSGMRPDSIAVMSMNVVSGKTVTFGLPRNLVNVPFPVDSPLHKAYPHGYGYHDTCNVDVCELNSISTEVDLKSPELFPDAAKNNATPGMWAMRDAAEGALGISIQYVVLIDMGQMEHLIDAMGGVTIDVKERLPVGGGVDANGNLTGVHRWIEKGVQHMNGNTALWYARSRHSTSDYDRMRRQRELQRAIVEQLTPAVLFTRFPALAKAGVKAVQTDIPGALAGVIAGLVVKSRAQTATTIEFSPPLVPHPDVNPDYAFIHRTVAKALG